MIILDTNVISELMRPQPDPTVAAWIRSYDAQQFALTAINVAEIRRGISRLPHGKRRDNLEQNFDQFLQDAFGERIWAFDEAAANLYGTLAARREEAGRSVDPVDLMIAAIAKYHRAAIATRNTNDFSGLGIKLINPREADAS